MVNADGSNPKEVQRWQQQQTAEAELAAAEEAVNTVAKVGMLHCAGVNAAAAALMVQQCRSVRSEGRHCQGLHCCCVGQGCAAANGAVF